ncbi:MAG: Predicted maltose transporter MalT, partial [uncultured Gemmatimonadetes bacterium]
DRETAPELLADVQHELRLPGHPVRLGASARQHVGRVRAAGRAAGRGAAAVAGGAGHGAPGAAHRGRDERPHLGAAGAAAALLPGGRHPGLHRPLLHAHLQRPLDGGGAALDPGRQHQHLDGAVPRLRGGQAEREPAHGRLRHAVVLHRGGRQLRQRPPLLLQLDGGDGEHAQRHPPVGEVLVPGGRGGLLPVGAVDGGHHHGAPPGGPGGVRAGAEPERDRDAVQRDRRGHPRHARDHEAARRGAGVHLAGPLLHVALFRPHGGAPRLRRHRSAVRALHAGDRVGGLRLRLLFHHLLPGGLRAAQAGGRHQPQDDARAGAGVRRGGAAERVPDPQPVPPPAEHGGGGDRVGVDPFHAVRHPFRGAPGGADGAVHGCLQLLHRHPGDRGVADLRPPDPRDVRPGQPGCFAVHGDAGRGQPAGGGRVRGPGTRRCRRPGCDACRDRRGRERALLRPGLRPARPEHRPRRRRL